MLCNDRLAVAHNIFQIMQSYASCANVQYIYVCVCEHVLNSGESRTLAKEEGAIGKGSPARFFPKIYM